MGIWAACSGEANEQSTREAFTATRKTEFKKS